MTNRQLAAAQTRKKLMAAAKTIIGDKGLSNTSVEEITEACGVSKGTFYTYFKRKEDIVFALSAGMFDEILEQALEGEGGFLEMLSRYLVDFAEYIEKSSVKLAQEWIKNVADPDTTQVGREKLNKDRAALETLLRAGMERGLLRGDTPVDQLTDALNDLIYGQLLCWAMCGGAYSFAARTRAFCAASLPALLRDYLGDGPIGKEYHDGI